MGEIRNTKTFMRVVHRYLGYFMAGIMAVYAFSGVILVYRDTDFLKKNKKIEEIIDTHLTSVSVGKKIKIRDLEFTKVDIDTSFFKDGWYKPQTGEVCYVKKELPFFIDKMVNLHKAKSAQPLSPLNVLFGTSLFFFVVSSFWMFSLKSKIFRKGMWFTLMGLLVALILLFQ